MKKTPEQLLEDLLARCTSALTACLDGADAARADNHNLRRIAELDSAAALLTAGARLGDTLARLRGETRHNIRVTREGVPPRQGSNGQKNRQA